MSENSILGLVDIVKLEADTKINSFESEDKDLNDFLLNDAKNYLKSLLAVTYILQIGDETIAYFSLSNDNLIKNDGEKSVWNRLNRAIPNDKRRRSYPAVKIGRLAVAKKYAGMGRCPAVLQKNDFNFLTEQDRHDDTRTMYFDLKAI
jgi:hypothetical protein